MRKIILCLFLLVSSIASAQTFQGQMLVGKMMKATAEATVSTDKIYSYSYLETSEAYYWLQQIVEVTIHKKWSAHLEYRTGDIFMAGIAKGIIAKDWYISLCALGRYEHKALTGQIGAFWQYNKNKIDIYGYVDGWWDKKACTYLEQRFYYEVVKDFSLGVVVNVTNVPQWEVLPYFGMSIKL